MKTCTHCVMDSTAQEISFDLDGKCSFCKEYEEMSSLDLHDSKEDHKKLLDFLEFIKFKRRNKKYDCLIGVSGGVDSSYVAYLLKRKYKLNPIAVHLDNGWNSELAVSNLENIMKKLEIDLFTHVLDWTEFKDVQLAFLKSSISNIEIPTDHAIWSILIRKAAEMGIPFIIAGNNVVTESVMPKSWLYHSKDSRLIKDIIKKFGNSKKNAFPLLSLFDYFYFLLIKRIKWLPLLNYINFNKAEAKKILIRELGWRDYGGKHYESIFTRFFHSYFLNEKFGYDLRKPYLSALICSKQISRKAALEELSKPPDTVEQIRIDKSYVSKKFGLEEKELDKLINQPNKNFSDYKNHNYLWNNLSPLVKVFRKIITKI